jgi:uncharacterized membrane protein YfcA
MDPSIDWLAPPLPAAQMVASLGVVLLAGIVRGFAGFGFSALAVAGLSVLVPPARVVPTILLLEIAGSLSLLPGALREVDARWLRALVAGNALAIPLGVALLAVLPDAPLRAAIGAALLVGALALRSGWHPRWQPTAPVRLAVGLVSGLFNGLAAIGGIAVAVLLASTALAPQALRATLIALFLFTDLWSLVVAAAIDASGLAANRLTGLALVHWAVWLAPAMFAGIAIGARRFGRHANARLRARMVDLIVLVAAVAVASSVVRLAT